MGFREMKENFDADRAEIEKLDVFRRNYLRCLFEIAGNLDTIAICQRALVEQADKTRAIIQAVHESNQAAPAPEEHANRKKKS